MRPKLPSKVNGWVCAELPVDQRLKKDPKNEIFVAILSKYGFNFQLMSDENNLKNEKQKNDPKNGESEVYASKIEKLEGLKSERLDMYIGDTTNGASPLCLKLSIIQLMRP